ncbi:hypothetical protein BCR43DRAFT_481245 [Syncephalastrum racemosum]|uniref:Uncharacterized protein n=1 Tax=Syncephalastrum racemosum TaxID=13706 RepID=A0A1X2HT20_SYNRA|nr:hypothetical protein BCR43DRAFT_481245 [Syncephalastrum racemosum]
MAGQIQRIVKNSIPKNPKGIDKSKPSPIIKGRLMSKKKQKQYERALKNEQKHLLKRGLIDAPEEEMTDADGQVMLAQKVNRVTIDIPAEILAAAANGPGTTLGQPN